MKATVLVPTHDHGPTLEYSVGSALAQTIEDLEVLIVGDGVPDATREVVARLRDGDPRVRFFDFPKGPRHGEIHRHQVLTSQARGEIVCYLADDDLWFPDHLEEMATLLTVADFASTLPVFVRVGGGLKAFGLDLSLPATRRTMQRGLSFFGLSSAGHTLSMYRRLPHGWRTTPSGIATDLYMWQQFLAIPACRAASSPRPTMLHFPSPWRRGHPIDQRVTELETYHARLADLHWRRQLELDILAAVVREQAKLVTSRWWRLGCQLRRPLNWIRERVGSDRGAG